MCQSLWGQRLKKQNRFIVRTNIFTLPMEILPIGDNDPCSIPNISSLIIITLESQIGRHLILQDKKIHIYANPNYEIQNQAWLTVSHLQTSQQALIISILCMRQKVVKNGWLFLFTTTTESYLQHQYLFGPGIKMHRFLPSTIAQYETPVKEKYKV